VFRLTLGINICVHGAGRIFGQGADAFASTTAAEFSKTSLPLGYGAFIYGAFILDRGAIRRARARRPDNAGPVHSLDLGAGRTLDRRSGLRNGHAERLEHSGCSDVSI
jgi:hypothetical protein